jgi:hypothetical protein
MGLWASAQIETRWASPQSHVGRNVIETNGGFVMVQVLFDILLFNQSSPGRPKKSLIKWCGTVCVRMPSSSEHWTSNRMKPFQNKHGIPLVKSPVTKRDQTPRSIPSNQPLPFDSHLSVYSPLPRHRTLKQHASPSTATLRQSETSNVLYSHTYIHWTAFQFQYWTAMFVCLGVPDKSTHIPALLKAGGTTEDLSESFRQDKQ